jgi:hypothetical protein
LCPYQPLGILTHSGFGKDSEMRANLFRGLSIQAARRFIRDYNRWIGDDGTCDCNPLLLSA